MIYVKGIVEATQSLIEYFKSRGEAVVGKILETKNLSDDIVAELKSACDEWKRSFANS
jgi:F0F1-type ATP synthase alpha subunit